MEDAATGDEGFSESLIQKLNPLFDKSTFPTNGHSQQHQNQQVNKN